MAAAQGMGEVPQEMRLGIEEVALAMSMAGYPDMAKAILFTTFGELPSAEEEGRMLAAGHSLLARDLATIQGGKAQLSKGLKPLMEVMCAPAYMVQYTLASASSEQSITYLFKGRTTVAQRIEQGVVYLIRTVQAPGDLVNDAYTFFGIDTTGSKSHPDAVLPIWVLDSAGRNNNADPEIILDTLRKAQVPDTLAHPLTEDVLKGGTRGAVLLVENKQGEFRSDHGMLVLKSQERTWLFPIVERGTEAYARILIANRHNFARELRALIANV